MFKLHIMFQHHFTYVTANFPSKRFCFFFSFTEIFQFCEKPYEKILTFCYSLNFSCATVKKGYQDMLLFCFFIPACHCLAYNSPYALQIAMHDLLQLKSVQTKNFIFFSNGYNSHKLYTKIQFPNEIIKKNSVISSSFSHCFSFFFHLIQLVKNKYLAHA